MAEDISLVDVVGYNHVVSSVVHIFILQVTLLTGYIISPHYTKVCHFGDSLFLEIVWDAWSFLYTLECQCLIEILEREQLMTLLDGLIPY